MNTKPLRDWWYRKVTNKVDVREVLASGETPPLNRKTLAAAHQQLIELRDTATGTHRSAFYGAALAVRSLWESAPLWEEARLHANAKRAWDSIFQNLHKAPDDHDALFTTTIMYLEHLGLELRDRTSEPRH